MSVSGGLHLHFDEVKVNTELAQKYLDDCGHEFHSIGYHNSEKFVEDAWRNKIYFSGAKITNFQLDSVSELHTDLLSIKLKSLAQKVSENKQLFLQLEYMLRNIPPKETERFDLKLIIQNFLHVSGTQQRKEYNTNVIVMNGKSPLATLGFVAQVLCTNEEVVIHSTPDTAVVCCLFTKLCHDVGLKFVRLAIDENHQLSGIDPNEMKELQSCGIGVVTERSDVDSAVDVFLATATRFPWRLRRVLVQESASDRFKNAIAWKTSLKRSNKDLDRIRRVCSHVYATASQSFLYEYVGDEPLSQDCVIIETYRTVKELLNLLNVYKPLSVSLWCSDNSESNEIAYGIDSTIVWINDYGSFEGPSRCSQSFYSVIDVLSSSVCIKKDEGVEKVLKHVQKWVKLAPSDRLDILRNSLADKSCNCKVEGITNFVEVANGKICTGLEVPVGLVLYRDTDELDGLVMSLLKGNAVCVVGNVDEKHLCRAMLAEGVPITLVGETEGDFVASSQYSDAKVKVVWMRYGTIFAN